MKIKLLVAVGLVLFAVSSVYAEEYVIKFSHVVAPGTPKGRAADLFAKLVNERLKGKVKVEVYPNSQLYNDDKVMEAMRLSDSKTSGILAAPSLSKFVKFSNNLQAFDLPFLFNDLNDVHTLVDSDLTEKMIAPLEKKGIKALAFWDNGMKVFSVKGDKPLRKVPDDFKGKKFRIQTSDVHEEMIKALGGIPQKLPFNEVYTALGQGVVDGQENAWSNIYSKKFHEVQDYISVSNHGYLGYLLVVSTDFWNRLPKEIQKQLMTILKEVTLEERKYAEQAESTDRDNIANNGHAKIVELTPAEKTQWVKATSKVEGKFAKEIGGDLLQDIHKLLKH